jgi:hypothetical protein
MTTARVIVIALLFSAAMTMWGQAAPARASAANSGCPNFTTIDEFVLCQAMAVLDKQQVGQNGKGSDRQKDSPSADARSTSLVDQSSATDFISVAASLIPVAPSLSTSGPGSTTGSSQTGTGTGTITSSLYALMAALNKTSPTDPAFYKDHVNARRISFTIGTAASTQATDNTTTPATVYAAKVLLANSRELYTSQNLKRIRILQELLSSETVTAAQLTTQIEQLMCIALHPDCVADHGLQQVMLSDPGKGYTAGDMLTVGGGSGGTVTVLTVDGNGAIKAIVVSSTGIKYSIADNLSTTGGSGTGATLNVNALASIDAGIYRKFQATQLSPDNIAATVKGLPPDAQKQIQALVESSIHPFSALRAAVNNTYDEISKGLQMSISGTADIRTGQGNNGYRAEFISDYGLSTRINWTVNGSFDYTDRKSAKDSRGGRLATSFQGNLTNPAGGWSKAPLTLTFSGEGDWLSSQKPQYSFDAKLSVPIASGFDLPIEYRYANRAAQSNQHDSQVRLGLTVDISRIAQALK